MAASVYTPVEDPGTEDVEVTDFFGPIKTYEDLEIEEIRQYVVDAVESEKRARQRHEVDWRKGYDLLMNRHSFVGKADWQSKVVISKVVNTVNHATAILKAGVTQTRDWFDLVSESADPLDQALLPYLKLLARAQVEERDLDSKMDLLDNWIIGLKCAMVTAPLVFKVVPRMETRKIRRFRFEDEGMEEPEDPRKALMYRQMKTQGASRSQIAQALEIPLNFTSDLEEVEEVTIKAELVDPFDFFPDTTGANRYDIQKIRGDLVELDRMTEASGFIPSALEVARGKIKGRTIPEEEDEQRERVEEEASGPERRFSWSGIEFWGVVHGQDGRTICKDHVVTIIEGVVVRVAENKFEDGRPFTHTPVEPVPFSKHGRGTITPVVGVATAIIELSNAVLDSIKYEVLKAWELDVDLVSNPKELTKGIVPGGVFSKANMGGKDRKMLTALDVGKLPGGVLALLTQLDRWYQEGTAVTELTQGLAPMRGTPTATEIADRRQGTNIAFRSIAQWMEKASLEPILTSIFNRMLSFRVFGKGGRRWVEKVLGPQEATRFFALVAERIDAGQGSFRIPLEFKVTALSNIVARAQELDKLTALLQVSQGIPGFINRLKMDKMAVKIINALGYDGEDLMKSEEEMRQIEQMEQMTMRRLAEASGEQPRSNSGISNAAAGAIAPSGT